MNKMIKLFIIAIISLTSTFFVLGGKVEVEAICGLGQYYDGTAKKCDDVVKSSNQEKNISRIDTVFKGFAYSIIYLATGLSLIMIVYSGFQYTMSEGDTMKILEAKANLIRAGIGILVAFSSYNILKLLSAFSTL